MKNTKGFSLIELSIVLIIIGLLIAGITGGASLIRSAELRSTISEIRNYQTAVNAFYTEKGYLPGTNKGSSNRMALLYSGIAWQELHDAKITDFNPHQEIVNPALITDESNSPKGKMKGSFYVLGYVGTHNPNGNVINANSLFLVSEQASVVADAIVGGTAPIKVAVAKQIDEKMDDGKPASGKVIALGTAAADACQSTGTSPVYNDALTSVGCGLAIKLGV